MLVDLQGPKIRLGTFAEGPVQWPTGAQVCITVDDVHAETDRLKGLGVTFTQEPLEMGPVTTAVFDDTCGNLVQIASLR